jgi:hypothetical protein
MDLNNKKIERFSSAQLYYVQLSSYYNSLSQQFDSYLRDDNDISYSLCVFYISNVLNLIRKFHQNIGIIQFDNTYVEKVIFELMMVFMYELQEKSLQHRLSTTDVIRLLALSHENRTYESYYALINTTEREIFKVACLWIIEMKQEGRLRLLAQKARWFSTLVYLEMTLMYGIYYGRENLRKFYNEQSIMDLDMILFIHNRHYHYYNRLRKLKLIRDDFLL